MKNILPTGLAAFALFASSAFVRADDAAAIQGTWTPKRAVLGGESMPEEVLKMITVKLDHGKYEVLVGDSLDKGTYTIDPATQPKGMTATGTDGPNKGKTFPAIYELTGDTLKVCYDLSGAKAPTEFKSVPGTQLYLVSYSRKKE